MRVKIRAWPTVLVRDKPDTPNRLFTVDFSLPRCTSPCSLAHCLEKITKRGILWEKEIEEGESWNPQAKYLAAS